MEKGLLGRARQAAKGEAGSILLEPSGRPYLGPIAQKRGPMGHSLVEFLARVRSPFPETMASILAFPVNPLIPPQVSYARGGLPRGWVLGNLPPVANANAWADGVDLPATRQRHTATALPDGRVVVIGGIVAGAESTDSSVFDPATGTWTTAAKLITGYTTSGLTTLSRLDHATALLQTGMVLAVGGLVGSYWTYAGGSLTAATASSRCDLYDPRMNRWIFATPLPATRSKHSATTLLDGRVLVVGGLVAGTESSDCRIYDPAQNLWTAATALSAPRSRHASCLLPSGKVLVLGGSVSGGASSDCQVYDPALNSWASVAALGSDRMDHAAIATVMGQVLALGGIVSGSDSYGAAIYDPTLNAWTNVASMPTSRKLHGAVGLLDGSLLVLGGVVAGAASADVQAFTPALVTRRIKISTGMD